jgi:hypothetical protein
MANKFTNDLDEVRKIFPKKIGNGSGDIFRNFIYFENFASAYKKAISVVIDKYGNPLKWKLLGSGSCGSVYELSNGNVLKIQRKGGIGSGVCGGDEAVFKKVMRGKPKHIQEIISVKRVEFPCFINGRLSNKNFIFIESKKYKRLNYREVDDLSILDSISFCGCKTWSIAEKRCVNEAKYMYRGGNASKIIKKLKKYNIDKMIDEYGRIAGKSYGDWHTGNIMKGPSGYVLIDL